MTYLKRSNPSGRKNWVMTSLIVLGLALLFLIGHLFPNFYWRILSPFTNFAWRTETGISGWFGSMAQLARGKAALIAENDNLRSQISTMNTSALLLQTTENENDELKALLGRKDATKDVLAVVLSRPPASPYDTFIIDVGADEGIKIGNKVYVDGSVLIGDVSEVLGKTSKVSLFSTPGRTVQVLLGPTHKEVSAVGSGGGNFTAKLPVGLQVDKGETLALPQLRDHVFGVVANIVADSTDSLQTIFFKAPVNLSEVRLVQVEK